jgi:CBS domain-containing protein
MSFWTFFKILAALCVLAFMSFTGMLVYHVLVTPLGGVFEQIIPNPTVITQKEPDAEIAKMMDSSNLPVIDPGEKAFEKAYELLAMGDIPSAREKLTAVVSVFPGSTSAPIARHIVGEMNLDEVLSASHMEGKKIHVVKRGNSPLSIAAEHRTTLDNLVHLNNMLEFKGLQPGEELLVMPLDFHLLIEPERKVISVWDGPRFVCDYPILHLGTTGKIPPGKTKIASKLAEFGGRQVQPLTKEYRGAEKVIQLAKPSIQIRGSSKGDELSKGIVLQVQDMEEISLLTRVGNEVEFR